MAAVLRTCSSAARGLHRMRPSTLQVPNVKSVCPSLRPSVSALRTLGRRFFSQEARPALTMLADHERMLKDSVHEFARSEIAPHVAKMDQDGKLVPSVLPALFANGYMGLEIDEKYGGGHMSFFESCLAIEEIAKVDPAIAVIVDIQNTLINTIFRRFGSQAIKDKWLPRLATDTLGSFCLSEHGSGSDAFALKTSAKRDGDYFLLNGTKMWISNANEAGVFIVFANADFSKLYKGITAFVVEAGTPGLQIGKAEDKLGIRASSTCEVVFDNVKVHKDSILGEEGKGYKIAIESLNEGRIGIGAQMVGLAQGTFDATMPYIMQRKQFGQVVANFQGMQFSYAQARTSIEAARLLVYNAARLKDAGKPFIQEAAMAKLYSSQIAEQVASKAIEWCGGIGFTKSMPQEKYFRDAKIGSIYEGTTNLQLQTIAQLLQKQYH